MSLTIDKTKKYDRQLRLWGESGQLFLESSKVCLIGCDSVGSEIAKNLILPGVGYITIIDNTIVTENDLSNNFFLEDSDLGRSRAQATSSWLAELNDEVRVSFVDESLESMLQQNPEQFLDFSVVIACGLNNSLLVSLDRLLYPENVPLLVCYSLGMLASLRVTVREHVVLDSRPENERPDLRLDRPLASVVTLSDQTNLGSMDHKDISHCPWLIILFKMIQHFQEKFNHWPSTHKDRQLLKNMIKEAECGFRSICASRVGADGALLEESSVDPLESFEEAVRAVNTAVHCTEIPENVRQLFDNPRCTNLDKDSRPFWVLVAALRQFWRDEDQLPVRGDIPDMTADTARYVTLQHAYREVAEAHATQMGSTLATLRQTYQIPYCDGFSEENIRKFAKKCRNVHMVSTGALERELKTSPSYTEDLACPESGELSWYLALRASISFLTVEGRLPGQHCGHLTDEFSDVAALRRLLQRDLTSGCSRLKGASVRDEYLHEMCRYAGSQLHSVSAFMGGVAAQETIKLLTSQFMPLMQPLLYNAISQTTHLLDL